MLSTATIQALTIALAEVEAHADTHGWDAPPVLYALFDRRLTDTESALEIDPFPVQPAQLHSGRDDDPLPMPLLLEVIAHAATNSTDACALTQWLRADGRTPIAFGFCCEGWTTRGYPGYQPGDLTADPSKADGEARVMVACDIDGRIYQIIRTRGVAPVEATIWDHPSPELRDTTVVHALELLVTLTTR